MQIRGGLLYILFVCGFIGACAAQEAPYPYGILRVVDGDTLLVEAPFLPLPLKPTLYLRLSGIDTPERGQKAKCVKESRRADHAKSFVETELQNANDIKLVIHGWDKYGGRILGAVYVDGVSLAEKLINENYAIEYDGGEKLFNWCGPS